MEGLGANFFGTYAALKFSGNGRRQTVIGGLFKAALYITWMMVLFPIAILQLLLSIRVTPTKAPRPTTHRGYPARFHDHVQDLQEEMK